MFSHIMIGTNDMEKAKSFYDALLGTLDVPPGRVDRHRIFYRTKTGTFSVSQPIEDRTNELISGSRADVQIQIFGNDLPKLAELAGKVAERVRRIDGTGDVRVERVLGAPTITASVDRARLARYGAGAFFVLLAAGAAHLVSNSDIPATHFHRLPPGFGSVEALGTLLFGSDVIPFELATALLLVAVVGAIAVARGKPHVRRESTSKSPTARMFHGPLMARDAQRPLPSKAQKAAAKALGGM